MDNTRIDLVLLCWNELELTKGCLESLFRETDLPSRLILIDNGSDAPAAGYLRSVRPAGAVREVRLLRNEANEGYARGMNRGLRESSAPWICLLNNDTRFTRGWLSELVRVMEREPRLGMLNPASDCLSFTPPPVRNPARPYPEGASWMEAPGCSGFCLLLRREALEQAGLFDEQFSPGYFEDKDLSLRFRNAGWDCGIALRSYVHHSAGASFGRRPDRQAIFDRNRERFYSKWSLPRPERIAWVLDDRCGREAAAIREAIRKAANADNEIRVFYTPGARECLPVHFRVGAKRLFRLLARVQVRGHLMSGKRYDKVLWGANA